MFHFFSEKMPALIKLRKLLLCPNKLEILKMDEFKIKCIKNWKINMNIFKIKWQDICVHAEFGKKIRKVFFKKLQLQLTIQVNVNNF